MNLSVGLSAFRKLSRRTLIVEGKNSQMEMAAISIPKSDAFSHPLPPRGGFILRLDD
jgi:hypothetical protein